MSRFAIALATRARDRRRRAFHRHLLPYVCVVIGLTLLQVLLAWQHPWALWLAMGWGIGLLLHAIVAFHAPLPGLRSPQQRLRTRLARP